MKLEDQLRDALRRQDPPAGFAERIIQQAGPARANLRQAQPKRRPRVWWPAFAAAAAAVVLSLSVEYRHRQEEEAGREAIVALRIASQKLNSVRDKVNK